MGKETAISWTDHTFNPHWACSLRDQCKAAGVAFHMKQMGGLKPSMMPPIPADLMISEFPERGAA